MASQFKLVDWICGVRRLQVFFYLYLESNSQVKEILKFKDQYTNVHSDLKGLNLFSSK